MAKAKEQGHGQEGAFYAVAGVQKDGTLQEIGGEGRTWRTLEDFHRERGWRAGRSRGRGNPRGAAAFGDRSRMGAAEGRIRNADAFAESMAGTVLPLQAEGLSFRAIADRLNAGKKRTRHGCLWQANSVRRLLGRLEQKD